MLYVAVGLVIELPGTVAVQGEVETCTNTPQMSDGVCSSPLMRPWVTATLAAPGAALPSARMSVWGWKMVLMFASSSGPWKWSRTCQSVGSCPASHWAASAITAAMSAAAMPVKSLPAPSWRRLFSTSFGGNSRDMMETPLRLVFVQAPGRSVCRARPG